MTYCLAIAVDDGLVFCSDSRTQAGADQVGTYGKMHVFGIEGDRQVVLLSAGNLATTQAVISRIKRDIAENSEASLWRVPGVPEAADYLGSLLRAQLYKHGEALARDGFSAEASFILGGQIGDAPPELRLVYPQGNHITPSPQTPFLQLGETKYGRPILDRLVDSSTDLEAAGRCALVSMDSTMRSNATVGPPIELLAYRRDSLRLKQYLYLEADAPGLARLRRAWAERIRAAFDGLPPVDWGGLPEEPPARWLAAVQARSPGLPPPRHTDGAPPMTANSPPRSNPT